MYNRKLLRTLEDRFDKLQAYLFRSFDGEEDLYSYIAHIMYNRDYVDCCEMRPDGTPNPDGKYYRNKAKEFILPLVAECGGLLEGEKYKTCNTCKFHINRNDDSLVTQCKPCENYSKWEDYNEN